MQDRHKSLLDYLASKANFSEEEEALICEYFQPRDLKKRQFLLHEGSISLNTAFVVKGTLRKYLIDNKGKEHITQFAIENWWIGDRESMTYETPSSFNIDALEDSQLLVISKNKVKELEEKVPKFKAVMDQLKENSAFAGQKRVVRALSYSAEEKYEEFMRRYPTIAQRVPLHMIASYLGITSETLSRLRNKAAKG